MMKRKTTYTSYLLRVWRENENGDWRVALKNVQNGEQRTFTAVNALADFLAQDELCDGVSGIGFPETREHIQGDLT